MGPQYLFFYSFFLLLTGRFGAPLVPSLFYDSFKELGWSGILPITGQREERMRQITNRFLKCVPETDKLHCLHSPTEASYWAMSVFRGAGMTLSNMCTEDGKRDYLSTALVIAT